ncbi:hypothetical protein C8T65DRAFT_828384 [Cerioporus squamosus]|nr:hypothetical protein C8T65DRAFT_828384 [Cerioporus squamosus]
MAKKKDKPPGEVVPSEEDTRFPAYLPYLRTVGAGITVGLELGTCDGPGCGQWYHHECLNLQMQPKGDWFCDDDCRANAGLPIRKAKRRKT